MKKKCCCSRLILVNMKVLHWRVSLIMFNYQNTKQKKIDASCRLIGTMSQQQLKAASKHKAANYDDDTDQEDDDNDW